ncbi:MAG: extracellular solute-binding protein [candidate division WOR-3 bacterium]
MQLLITVIFSKIIILHAGSLNSLISEMAREFQRKSGIEVVRRSAGSLMLANLIIEKRVDWDIFFSADYQILQNLLVDFAESPHPFARNEIVIAYTERSPYSKELSQENWYKILSKKGLRIGRSNPRFDPCGYRVILLLEIVRKIYGENVYNDLKENLKDKYVRPGTSQVLNLLEMGEVDYVFTYLSEAKARNLPYIAFSDTLNFGNPDLSDFYRSFRVKINNIEIAGAPIIYAYAINPRSKNRREILEFLKFFESQREKLIIKHNFIPTTK